MWQAELWYPSGSYKLNFHILLLALPVNMDTLALKKNNLQVAVVKLNSFILRMEILTTTFIRISCMHIT